MQYRKIISSITLASLIFLTSAGSVEECAEVAQRVRIDNTKIIYVSHHLNGSSIPLPGTVESCGGPTLSASIPADLCRIVLETTTSNASSVHLEAWLPDSWNGRFLATGTGGIGGCIDYPTVQNGASLGFASFGMNAGHNGSAGFDFFLNKPEVLIDFGYRSTHVEAEVGKELTRQYYGVAATHSYFASCSTGGRQGFRSATRYPTDFDGLLLGAPGVEWIRLVTSAYLIARRYGWPDVNSTKYVTNEQFGAITEKLIELLDPLDGVKDGIIDNPTHLTFDPQLFSCGAGLLDDSVCLKNAEQVESVRSAYEPIVDLHGHITYPSWEPGTDTSAFSANTVNGTGEVPWSTVRDFFRGAVYNDSTWSDLSFDLADTDFALSLDPGLVNTGIHEANLTAFKAAGGKIIAYHGRSDPFVTSALSEWYYNGARQHSGLSFSAMNEFYRLFFIPGMQHCSLGPGAWNIGQVYPLDKAMLDESHNAVLALVNWVETGSVPNGLIGTKYANDDVNSEVLAQRKHCPYPLQSKWNGKGKPAEASSWDCNTWVGY